MRLLIADDSGLLRRSLIRALRARNPEWSILEAGDAEQAVAWLECEATRPDVVLTDWDMPHGGGARVVEECKRLKVPVVVYSGNAEIDIAPTPVVQKPAPPDEIEAALREAVDKSS